MSSVKKYVVTMEVEGAFAMFSRPDTGGTPTSYQVPTWSAAKGIFESVAFLKKNAWICPIKVEVCRKRGTSGGQVQYQRYTNNYGGPLRKTDLFKKGSAMGGSSVQIYATVLSNVCYRLYGIVVGAEWNEVFDARHYLQELFQRRLKQGRCHRTPCLGWREFTCSYWGEFRRENEVDSAFSCGIPSMLLSVWDTPFHGVYRPVFRQNVHIIKGVLEYDVPQEWLQRGKSCKETAC